MPVVVSTGFAIGVLTGSPSVIRPVGEVTVALGGDAVNKTGSGVSVPVGVLGVFDGEFEPTGVLVVLDVVWPATAAPDPTSYTTGLIVVVPVPVPVDVVVPAAVLISVALVVFEAS